MTGIETAAAGVLVRVVIERAAPAGLEKIRSVLRGKTVMIVGPPQSGKSTFVQYLQYGIFQEAQDYEPTYHPKDSTRFNLKLGPDRALEVLVKTAVDLPGQYPDLPDKIYEKRPHALVAVVDLSAPLDDRDNMRSSAIWLSEFFRRLDQQYQRKKARRNRLRSVIVVLNKMDLVTPEVVASSDQRYRSIIDQYFHAARGEHVNNATFKRCIMVDNPDKTKLIDAVLIDLAISLSSK